MSSKLIGASLPSSNAIDKGRPLSAMALILPQSRANSLCPPVAHKFQPAEVVQHCGATPTKNLNPLFGKRTIPVREIADDPFGAIAEPNGNQHIIPAILPRASELSRTYFNDRRTGKEHHQVDEVTHFAQNPASALFAIVHPMVGRQGIRH